MGNILKALQDAKAGEFGLTEFSVSILFSLAAGLVCLFLYRLYFTDDFDRNDSLGRSFIVIAPAISAIFWAIQYSLPLSLGLLGALSFVRFRTPIKKPEDIGFILLVVALALLSSVFRFFAAGILLGVLAAVVLVKTFLIEKQIWLLRTGSYLTIFLLTKTGELDAVDRKIREALWAEFAGLKAVHLKFNDAVQKDAGYSLRYTLHFKQVDDNFIPRTIAALNKSGVSDKIEVFVGKNV